MPEGRMLKKVITTSQKLATLKSDSARLFYTWLIPYADCEGRLRANPYILKGIIFPYLRHTPRRIVDFLKDCHRVGLITMYENSDEQYLQIEDFHKYQAITRKKDGTPVKESKSTIPSCPKELRSVSRATPDQLPSNSTESKVKGSKVKGNEYKKDKKEASCSKEEINKEFEEFWKFYRITGNSKDDPGDKSEALKAYRVLRRLEEKKTIARAVSGYADHFKAELDRGFKKRKMYASTFLRSRKWERFSKFKYEPEL